MITRSAHGAFPLNPVGTAAVRSAPSGGRRDPPHTSRTGDAAGLSGESGRPAKRHAIISGEQKQLNPSVPCMQTSLPDASQRPAFCPQSHASFSS